MFCAHVSYLWFLLKPQSTLPQTTSFARRAWCALLMRFANVKVTSSVCVGRVEPTRDATTSCHCDFLLTLLSENDVNRELEAVLGGVSSLRFCEHLDLSGVLLLLCSSKLAAAPRILITEAVVSVPAYICADNSFINPDVGACLFSILSNRFCLLDRLILDR